MTMPSNTIIIKRSEAVMMGATGGMRLVGNSHSSVGYPNYVSCGSPARWLPKDPGNAWSASYWENTGAVAS